MTRGRRTTFTGAALLCALAAAVAVAAQDAEGSFFPLEVGRSWTYVLRLKVGQASKSIEYTTHAMRQEDVPEVGPCVVLESRSDQRVLQTNWYRFADGALRNPKRRMGGPGGQVGTFPSRVLYEQAAVERLLEGADQVTSWPWTCSDGSKGSVTLDRREQLDLNHAYRDLDCIVLLDRGTFLVGTEPRTQEREVWLARGIGMVKEITRVRKGGGEVVLESEAVLKRHDVAD